MLAELCCVELINSAPNVCTNIVIYCFFTLWVYQVQREGKETDKNSGLSRWSPFTASLGFSGALPRSCELCLIPCWPLGRARGSLGVCFWGLRGAPLHHGLPDRLLLCESEARGVQLS